LGADDAAREFFRSMKLRTREIAESGTMPPLTPNDTVVIWNANRVTANGKREAARPLRDFAASGGRVIVLSAHSWDWRELCDVNIEHEPRFSRVFPARDIDIDPQWLLRWNGLPGTVARGKIDGDVMKQAKPILWAKEPTTVVMASVPAASGKGTILFSLLNFYDFGNEVSVVARDPVAARLLLRLLERDF